MKDNLKKTTPKTFEECFKSLDELLNDEQKNTIRNTPVEEFRAEQHLGLGLFIRNQWLYPEESKLKEYFKNLYKELLRDKDDYYLYLCLQQDDLSGAILFSYWHHLRGLSVEGIIRKIGEVEAKKIAK